MTTTTELLDEAKGCAATQPQRAEKIYSDILGECSSERSNFMD